MGVFAEVGPLPVFVSSHVRLLAGVPKGLRRLTIAADTARH